MVQPSALIQCMKPAKHQDNRWAPKYYVGRVYLVWQHCELELHGRYATCTEAQIYTAHVVERFLRMYIPKDSSQ
jgi:hypothetical protein